MLDRVKLTAGGKILTHRSCALSASAEEAVRTASFEVVWTGPGLPCMPDEDATIEVSGELWGTGYVRDVNGQHDAAGRVYQISFVSRTCDATECSIDHPTMLARDVDLIGIAKTFDTLGIGVDGAPKTEKKRTHKVVPGESLFDTIEAEARAQGVLIHDTPQGKLKLADKPEGRHSGGLVLGVNIAEATGQLSGAKAFSPISVRGQASEGVSAASLRPEATARGTAKRKRPLILIQEGEATSARLKRRADWEARRAAGDGISASIVTPGWRDADGKLWTRNFLVAVNDPWLGIDQDMVIAEVGLRQDGQGGTVAELTLKDPRSLGGENPRGKSSDAWAAPETAEPDYREDDDV
jgi:prophage tail gpP-like protein